MDAGRSVAMASLSPTTVAAATIRPSSGRGRLLPKVTAMAAQNPKPASGTRRSLSTINSLRLSKFLQVRVQSTRLIDRRVRACVRAVLQGTTVFPLGEPGPRQATSGKAAPPVKLLTNVEKLRLLTKAEKAGLLSAAERAGLSLSAVERLGLLSKAEELEVLSAATDPGTPGALLGLALLLLAAGPAVVYLVPEEYPWQVAVQAVAALVCVVVGSAAFAASSFVSKLQGSSS